MRTSSLQLVKLNGKTIQTVVKPQHQMQKTGKILLTTELAEELGFTDVNGKIPGVYYVLA